MEKRKTGPTVLNGILILLVFIFSSPGPASAGRDPVGFSWPKRPIAVYAIPGQEARAKSNFTFHIAPFVSTVQKEVTLQLTDNLPFPVTINLLGLPIGVTRTYVGENLCGEVVSLSPSQSCSIRFNIDDRYKKTSPSSGCYPRIQLYNNVYPLCSQFDKAVHDAGNTQINVSPTVQDGLQYDSSTHKIVGQPTRTGVYYFNVSATNNMTNTASQLLRINVGINPADKPILKRQYNLAAATPGKDYQLNLMTLLETQYQLTPSNPIDFRIDQNHIHPDWISLDPQSSTILQGHVPSSEVGLTKELTIIAHSNTGGDSDPLTIQIPVAHDPEKKPILHLDNVIEAEAGALFRYDFRSHIADPAADKSLKLVVDRIVPDAPWLSIAYYNSTELTGLPPLNAVGQVYNVTLYANTKTGGNSDPVTFPLHIAVDKQFTPRFYATKPQLPILYAGQSYVHDFTQNRDIMPEYQDIPFTVALAPNTKNPDWVRIENNQLIIERVPDDLDQPQQTIYITITNIPGGQSGVLPLELLIMT